MPPLTGACLVSLSAQIPRSPATAVPAAPLQNFMTFPRAPRLWKRTQLAASTAALVLIASCADDDTSPVAPPGEQTARFAAAAPTAERPGGEFAIEDRFTLDLDVEGSLKPGQPIHLKLRGTASFATADAEVRVTLPEVAAAERSSWNSIALPIGEEIPPHIRFRRGFAAGSSFQERTTLVIPEPGYYLVTATVRQHSDDRMTDLPHMVSDVAQKDLWLWIDEHGGRITETFDTTLFAGDTRKERGPRTSKSKPPRIHKKGSYISCTVYPEEPIAVTVQACPGAGWTGPDAPAPPPPSSTQSFSVAYDHQGRVSPVPGARYLWQVRAAGGAMVSSGEGFVDAAGNIPVIDCQGTTSERTVSVQIYTVSETVRVVYSTSSGQAGEHYGPCGGSSVLYVNKYSGHLFLNLMKTAANHIRIFGALNPARITASLNDARQTGYYVLSQEIRVAADDNMVFGIHGAFVAAHEWGHMWMDLNLFVSGARDGLTRFYSRACARVHPPESLATVQCAWAEGFADWYAVVVRGSDTGRWLTDLESNFYHKNCQDGALVGGVRVVCSVDGGAVEGAIHSFLYDLTDGGSTEPWDMLQYEPRLVTDVIKNCRVKTTSGSSMAYDGVDHLIHCMEARAPYEVRIAGILEKLFTHRASSSRSQSYTGTNLARGSDLLRRTWLSNLYVKRFTEYPDFERNASTESIDPTIDPLIDPEVPSPDDPTDPAPEPCDNVQRICPAL